MKFNHLLARTDIFKFSFFPRTNPIPMWNSLPQEIVHATSPASFSAGVSAWRYGSSPYPLRWPTTVTAKPKTSRQKQNTSRQNQKPHDKTENLTAKPKISRQNQKRNFTAKTKYFTAKPNTHGKTKAILFLL